MGPASLPVHHRLKIGSSENLNRLGGGGGIPVASARKMPLMYGGRPAANGMTSGVPPTGVRSNSAIDLQAANRAARNMRAGYVVPLRKDR